MDQVSQTERSPQQRSKLKISEAALTTARMSAINAWFETVPSTGQFFERTRKTGVRPLDLGGQTCAFDLKRCFFRLSTDFPCVQILGLFKTPETIDQASEVVPGLHHRQLMRDLVVDLVEKYEALGEHGLRPHRSTNHAPMTSFYYRDPNGNNVEIIAQNNPSFQLTVGFMAKDGCKSSSSGAELDPAGFVAIVRAGAPVDELVRLSG